MYTANNKSRDSSDSEVCSVTDAFEIRQKHVKVGDVKEELWICNFNAY